MVAVRLPVFSSWRVVADLAPAVRGKFVARRVASQRGAVPEGTRLGFASAFPALTCGANECHLGFARGRLRFATEERGAKALVGQPRAAVPTLALTKIHPESRSQTRLVGQRWKRTFATSA